MGTPVRPSGGVCVITGGARGIGRALATQALTHGMSVVIVDVEQAALDEAAAMMGSPEKLLTVRADVSVEEDVEEVLQRTLERFGKVTVLYNNAGVGGRRVNLMDSRAEDWRWVFDVNVFGVLNGIRVFLPQMLRQPTTEQCAIVNTSSVAGIMPGGGAYSATKHAVRSITESLAQELRESKVSHINTGAIFPGGVASTIWEFDRIERNRRDGLARSFGEATKEVGRIRLAESGNMSTEEAARRIWEQVLKGSFQIFTHPELGEASVGMLSSYLSRGGPPWDTDKEARAKMREAARIPIPGATGRGQKIAPELQARFDEENRQAKSMLVQLEQRSRL